MLFDSFSCITPIIADNYGKEFSSYFVIKRNKPNKFMFFIHCFGMRYVILAITINVIIKFT